MKITYICNEYPPAPHGGIGTFVHTLAHGLVAEGNEVTVVGWGATAGERQDQGVRVVTLPACDKRGVNWLVNRRRLHRWLHQEVKAGRTELIETPEYDGPMPFGFTACPVVVRLHLAATTICRQSGRRLSWSKWWTENRTLKRHSNWVAVSQHSLDLTLDSFKATPRKQAVIYHPIPTTPASEIGELALPHEFILFAGAVSKRKGAFVLAEAARTLLAAHPSLHLVYAGAVVSEKHILADAHIRSLLGKDLSTRVHFLGRVERRLILGCMRKAKAFVFPSSLETFGLVVAEAMLEGCPVVVCNSGPFPEFVQQGRTGLLVPPNDPAAVASAVTRLLTEPRLAGDLAREGQESVRKRFSLAVAVQRNLDFYESCSANTGVRFGAGPRTEVSP